VGELVAWFARLSSGSANPKWTTRHGYELAYYVATHAESRKVDVSATRQAAYVEGVTISDGDRQMLERIGAIPVQPRAVGVPDGYRPTDDEVRAWLERHDLADSYIDQWRAAIDDARSMHLLDAAPAPAKAGEA
jgi:hypothetical protein